MIQESVVSRNEIFSNEDQIMNNEDITIPSGMFDFVEVEFDDTKEPTNSDSAHDDRDVCEPSAMAFRLFNEIEPSEISLVEPKEKAPERRPLSHYIFKPTSECRLSYETAAVTGEDVLCEAEFWREIVSKKPTALDINHNYITPKRKCRPGKMARLNRKLKNERLAQELKKVNKTFKSRRKLQFKSGRNLPRSFGKSSGQKT